MWTSNKLPYVHFQWLFTLASRWSSQHGEKRPDVYFLVRPEAPDREGHAYCSRHWWIQSDQSSTLDPSLCSSTEPTVTQTTWPHLCSPLFATVTRSTTLQFDLFTLIHIFHLLLPFTASLHHLSSSKPLSFTSIDQETAEVVVVLSCCLQKFLQININIATTSDDVLQLNFPLLRWSRCLGENDFHKNQLNRQTTQY